MTKSKSVLDAAVSALLQQERWKQLEKAFHDTPDVSCPKCHREILCGSNFCKLDGCPKKNTRPV